MKKHARQRLAARSAYELATYPEGIQRALGTSLALPVPRREAERVRRGNFDFDEMARWVRNFLGESADRSDAGEYRELAEMLEEMHRLIVLVREAKTEEAREGLERFLEAHPGHQTARLHLADALNMAGEHERAEEAARGVLETAPENLGALLIRSRALLSLRRRGEAAALLREAYTKAPGSGTLRRELVRIGELIPLPAGGGGQMRLMDRVEVVKSARQEFARALGSGQEGLPQVTRILIRLNTMGLFETVLEFADEALAQEGNPSLERAAAIALMGLGRNEEGEARVRNAIEGGLDDTASKVLLARFLAEGGRKGECEALLGEMLEGDANTMEAAEMYVMLGEGTDEQVARAGELSKKYPDSWAVAKLIGDLDFRLGDFEDALRHHRQAWEASGSGEALAMVLHDLDRLGRQEEAATLAEQVPDLGAKGSTARWNAGNLFLRTGRRAAGLRVLQGMALDMELAPAMRLQAAELLSELGRG